MNKTVNVRHIRVNPTSGINVYTNAGTIYGVSENVVRCQFGRDFDYLLATKNEAGCFKLSKNDIKDMNKFANKSTIVLKNLASS